MTEHNYFCCSNIVLACKIMLGNIQYKEKAIEWKKKIVKLNNNSEYSVTDQPIPPDNIFKLLFNGCSKLKRN